MAAVLPYVALRWEQVTPGDDEEFQDYVLERLNPESGEWEVIAVIDAVDEVEWDDYLAFPGASQYRVKWRAEVAGDLMESEPVTANAALEGTGMWLHDVADPDEQARLLGTEVVIDGHQALTQRLVGDARAPSSFVGAAFYAEIDVTLVPEDVRDPEVWEQLRALAHRQKTAAAIYCLRLMSRAGARWFVTIGQRGERGAATLSRGSVRFVEVGYDESGSVS